MNHPVRGGKINQAKVSRLHSGKRKSLWDAMSIKHKSGFIEINFFVAIVVFVISIFNAIAWFLPHDEQFRDYALDASVALGGLFSVFGLGDAIYRWKKSPYTDNPKKDSTG